MTDAKTPQLDPCDQFVNESKAPLWVSTFDAEERREQYADDLTEGKQLIKLITGIACIGLVLGILVFSYMFWIGTS